jgi:hypothetical protein
VENKFQLWVNGPEWIQPSDRVGNRKCRAMRQVNGYGVGKMADPAMLLIFKLIVPVAGSLECEGQYEYGHHNGHNSVCYPPPHVRPNTSAQILLRLGMRHKRE